MIKTFRSTNQQGFTIIELMLTIALLGVVVALALPSFSGTIARNQVSSSANTLVGAFNLARVEATKLGAVVGIGSLGATTDWASGSRIWVDSDDDGVFDNGEQELRRFEAINSALTLSGSLASTRFDPRGFASGGAITLTLCSAETDVEDRRVLIVLSGRVEVADFTCP